MSLQHEHVLLVINLQCNLGLAQALPASENWMGGVGAKKCLVAGERCMGALSRDLTWIQDQYFCESVKLEGAPTSSEDTL